MKQISILGLIVILCVRCAGFGEPKIVTAYRIYNDSKDTIEVISLGMKMEELTDSFLFGYARPYSISQTGVKYDNYREYIIPHGFMDVQSVSTWKRIVKENKMSIVVLNKDSVNAIKFRTAGLVRSCLVKNIPLILDSLEKVDFKIHFR